MDILFGLVKINATDLVVQLLQGFFLELLALLDLLAQASIAELFVAHIQLLLGR